MKSMLKAAGIGQVWLMIAEPGLDQNQISEQKHCEFSFYFPIASSLPREHSTTTRLVNTTKAEGLDKRPSPSLTQQVQQQRNQTHTTQRASQYSSLIHIMHLCAALSQNTVPTQLIWGSVSCPRTRRHAEWGGTRVQQPDFWFVNRPLYPMSHNPEDNSGCRVWSHNLPCKNKTPSGCNV